MDNVRVPSPATATQSQADAQAADPDRYRPQLGLTGSDAAPGEGTDLVGGDDTVIGDVDEDELEHIRAGEEDEVLRDAGVADEGVPFQGFDSPDLVTTRAHVLPTTISMSESEKRAAEQEMVPVIPRRNVLRTKIGPDWYNFVKGQEQFVPGWVRDHLMEKGVI